MQPSFVLSCGERQNMSKYKAIEIPIYNGVCWFYSGDPKKCARHFKKKHQGSSELFKADKTGACFVQDNDCIVAIYVKKHTNYGTLAHEAFHAVKHIMDQVGVTLSDNSEEAFAYLISFFVDEWMDSKKWVVV